MTHDRRSVLLRSLMAFDLMIAMASLYAAALIIGAPGLPRFNSLLKMRIQVLNVFQFAAFLVIWHLSFEILGLYHSRRLSSKRSELADVVKAVCIAAGTIYFLDWAIGIHGFSRRLFISFWLLAVIACMAARLVMRLVLRQARRHGRNLRHLLIVGSNPHAVELAEEIQACPWLGYHLLGFVDDQNDVPGSPVTGGVGIVTTLSGFGTFISTHVVDEVIICLPFQAYYQQATNLAKLCQVQGIIVRVSKTDLFNLQLDSARADTFEGDLVVTISTRGMQGWPAIMKTVLDRVLSVLALIALSPLLAATAIAITLSSPGPVLYVQERLGLNKRRFKLYKFRTMVVDAEARQRDLEHANEASGPVFKIQKDPRITAVGHFLRRQSIDELPQLVNVLKGDMSLVGPRPLPIRDCDGFITDWHRRRFSVRPGLSCLWQINGRSNIDFDNWMRLDMQYIDQWSFWLDLKIIAKTIRVVFKGVGAW